METGCLSGMFRGSKPLYSIPFNRSSSLVLLGVDLNIELTVRSFSMFVESCKRIRLMKSLDALGLGNQLVRSLACL